MAKLYSRLLGHYDGRPYFISVSVSPNINTVEDFSVAVHYNDPNTEREVQIARIDTAHETVHFDRLYRRNQPKDTNVDFSVWDAEQHLEENWRQYATTYAENHAD